MTIPRPGPTDHQDSPGLELDLLWDQLCDLAEATDIAATAHIAASAPHAGHATIGHTHDATYAPIAKGVTNGDAHDHAGGDGAQIAYAGLSGLPSLGGSASLNVGTTTGTVAAGDDSRIVNAATLSGKSGGQTLIGGTAASETLTLRSTAHATKGTIILGTLSAYDEETERLGIGTTSPSARMHAISTTEQLRLGNDVSKYAGFTVDSAGILLISPTSGEVDIATSSATATLGAELVVNNPSFTSDLSGWTDSGATWSWHATGSAAHTAGAASTLSQYVTVSSGSTYQIVVNISGRTAGSVSCTLGAVIVIESGTAGAFTSSFSRTSIAVATGSVAFTITPTTDFDGRIDDVSIKLVTLGTHPAALNILQGGSITAAVRVSYALDNLSFGREAGRSITSGVTNLNIGAYAGRSITTGTANTNLGVYAGYSETTGSNNTNGGISAGRNITTGFYNSNFGAYSGYSLTTGSFNVNCGVNAGYVITTGTGNSNVGNLSGRNITSGSNNSNFGRNAGYGITTTNQNATFGYDAGHYLADGATSLTTPSNCTYLGSSTKASADGVTAENVFGYNATGIGSNTVAIGDLSVIRTGLRGSVEIIASSSTTASQTQGALSALWVDSTHATRKARLVISAYDTAAREAIRVEGSGTAPLIGFYGAAAVAKPTALTTQLTTLTYTAPGTPDYAIAAVTQTTPFGFTTADEAHTVLSVIKNLQDRVSQLEAKLQALGLLT